ncbi:DUF2950 domain-containing protein [Paucibacter sp. TC2R-5]|uniref:DUF2950 domain-containing protein n=1 Tax=Paucibacter sp. TC2R-5 TaxID=2893555 RepID=UPI0021E48AC5|nr:DUF2950 domain-containing protein [Paucibacter sp. TC2R-5]MCV2359335.1 DUF2950 domain-containing protein [Paucibacter sp. TC2R-5]
MNFRTTSLKPLLKLRHLALVAGLALSGAAHAQTAFAKPEAAADAFIDAVASSDPVALKKVLGKDWAKLMPLGEVSADDRYTFLEKAHQARSVTVKQGLGEMLVGTDPWALPIPLLQGKDGQWRFDMAGGKLNVLERRIGANEHATIQALLASVDAQREYASVDRNGDGVLEYAQRIISTAGQRDGLIWPASLGDESPLGEAFLPKKAGEGYHGYRFKLLTAQGDAAKGGARSYLIGKRMETGFAMLAWPLKYGDSGVMSFMVNQAGQVFEADLGPNSAKAAAAITSFNPSPGWQAVVLP